LLAVVFVGIGGEDAGRVDKQMAALMHKDAQITTASVPAAALRTLARHGDGCREIVYDGDGGMKDLVETPLSGRQLARGDIESLRSNLMPDVVDLVHATSSGSPASDGDTGGDAGGDADPEPSLPVAPPPKHRAAPARHHEAAPEPAPGTDDEAAPGIDGPAKGEHEAAPTETADASDSVSADEALSLAMGGTDGDANGGGGGSIDTGANGASSDGLRMRASVGFGITGRGFSPAPTTLAGYASAPVGAVRLDAEIQPTARTSLSLVAERALGMTTPGLADGDAPTSLSRWQVSGGYAIVHGAVALAPIIGVGGRDFGIASKDPARTPDSHYAYVVAGATMQASLGSRVSLGGLAAVEPVFGGVEPTEMAFGEATRWALELGAAVDVQATQHVFVRAAANWQRFSWSWDQAGARGMGGAVDSYPSGTLSVGADY
jgi:hypothetical protein